MTGNQIATLGYGPGLNQIPTMGYAFSGFVVVPPIGTPDVARVSLLSADAASVRLLTSDVERVELNVD